VSSSANTSLSGEAFVAWDRLLDTAGFGPSYLGQAEIREFGNETIAMTSAAGGSCILHAFVIMPNHVHLMCYTNRFFG
jgi:hypothetical protein